MIFFDGFESGTYVAFERYTDGTGTNAVTSSEKHSGTYGSSHYGTAGSGAFIRNTRDLAAGNYDTIYTEFWMKLPATYVLDQLTFCKYEDSIPNQLMYVYLDDPDAATAREIKIYNTQTDTVYTSGQSAALDTWFKITIAYNIHATTGWIKLWYNDSLVIDQSGIATKVTGGGDYVKIVNWGMLYNGDWSAREGTFYVDDIGLSTTAFSTTEKSTGHLLPLSATHSAVDPYLDEAWSNAAGILTISGGAAGAAYVTAATFDSGDQTNILKGKGFPLTAIPTDATIRGIICRFPAWGTTSCAVDLIQLLSTDGSCVGNNKAATSIALTATTQLICVGGSADTWGNTWTSAILKHSAFGIGVAIKANANNQDVWIDYITLEVCYTEATVTTYLTGVSFVEC